MKVEEEAPEDVEGEEAVEEAAPAEPAAAAEDTSVMPLTPVRRIIAEHMARSSREIPAAWSMVEVDVTRLVRTRDALKAAFEERHGTPLTYLPFAAGALAAVLREHPRLNARWDDGHITLNNRVNLAVAVSTEAGLMVPVLRDADTLSIAAIAAELRRLSDGARAGTLGIEDVQGGTFTLNNTGALGSVVSVPIINHPQAAIMTTEAIVKRPVVVEGDAIAVRSMMNLCHPRPPRCDGRGGPPHSLSAVQARPLKSIDEMHRAGVGAAGLWLPVMARHSPSSRTLLVRFPAKRESRVHRQCHRVGKQAPRRLCPISASFPHSAGSRVHGQ